MLDPYKYHTQPQQLHGWEEISMMMVCKTALDKINHDRWDRGRDRYTYTLDEVDDTVNIRDEAGEVIGRVVKTHDDHGFGVYHLYVGDYLLPKVDVSEPFDELVLAIRRLIDWLDKTWMLPRKKNDQ